MNHTKGIALSGEIIESTNPEAAPTLAQALMEIPQVWLGMVGIALVFVMFRKKKKARKNPSRVSRKRKSFQRNPYAGFEKVIR